MTHLTTLKLVLAGIGIVLFFWAHRVGDDRLRWVGIAFVIVAVLLRFIRPRPRG